MFFDGIRGRHIIVDRVTLRISPHLRWERLWESYGILRKLHQSVTTTVSSCYMGPHYWQYKTGILTALRYLVHRGNCNSFWKHLVMTLLVDTHPRCCQWCSCSWMVMVSGNLGSCFLTPMGAVTVQELTCSARLNRWVDSSNRYLLWSIAGDSSRSIHISFLFLLILFFLPSTSNHILEKHL